MLLALNSRASQSICNGGSGTLKHDMSVFLTFSEYLDMQQWHNVAIQSRIICERCKLKEKISVGLTYDVVVSSL